MFDDEPSSQQIDALAKYLGITDKSKMSQYEEILDFGEKHLADVNKFLIEKCPQEYKEELVSRMNKSPETAHLRDFVEKIMPEIFNAAKSTKENQP